MVDSAQSALITAGKMPPSPEHMADMLREAFVETGMLSSGYVRAFDDLFNLHKNISHGKLTDIKGIDIDKWQSVAENFLNEMTRIVNKLLDIKKNNNS